MKNCNDLGEKIAARTLAGLIAKASIVEFIWDGEIGTDFDGADTRMVFHIAKDLMALARRIDARLRCRGEACGRGGRLYLAEGAPGGYDSVRGGRDA